MRNLPPDIVLFSDQVQIDSARQGCILRRVQPEARWQSGYAAACKAVYAGSIPTLASIYFLRRARVAELVDAADLKSAVRKDVRVQLPPWAPNQRPKAAISFQRRSQDYALVVFCALINPDFYYLYLLV